MLLYRPGAKDSYVGIAARFLGDESKAWWVSEANAAPSPDPDVPVVVPLVPLNPVGVTSEDFQTVPILAYHRLGSGHSKMIVSPANFAAQMAWLAANAYHVIRLSDLAGFLGGQQPLPRRSVVITFDDGYESVYRHAFPRLKAHGFPATVFVYTDFVGAGDAMSWGQLNELQASGLVDVQSHSKSHRNLIERLPGESEADYRRAIETELRVPRDLIERRVARADVRLLAYPYGDANEAVLNSAARHGYELAATVIPGGNGFFAQPLWLRRTMIFGDLSLEGFRAKLQTRRSLAAP